MWRRIIARRWRLWITLAVVFLGLVLAPWAMSGIGHWLVVEDPLEPASAVVVLGGQLPFRAMEAASIFHRGWAQEVWLIRASFPPEEAAVARLGVKVAGEEVYNRQVLERLGVREDRIRLLTEVVQNTAEEVQVIARELGRMGGERVIVVTSKSHSRRVRATWRALVGDSPRAVVRYAREDPYDPDRWWRRTRDALAVSREIFGLMNVWTGFPVKQESR